MSSRKYKLKKRAISQEATKQRIVEATIELHESIGVPGTTISAIAERAGVERLTVYRHFSDQHELLTACTGHYLAINPLPDPGQWESGADPIESLRMALEKIYAFYQQTAPMMVTTYRDTETVPTLRKIMEPFFQYWQGIQDHLSEKFSGSDETGLFIKASVGHAIHFTTWRSLTELQGLTNEEAIEVMVTMIQCMSNPAE